MKSIKRLTSAVLLTAFAAGALAASPYGPKPKCPLGQLPVLKNGIWVCAEPTIKAPGRDMESTFSGFQVQGTSTTRPQRAK